MKLVEKIKSLFSTKKKETQTVSIPIFDLKVEDYEVETVCFHLYETLHWINHRAIGKIEIQIDGDFANIGFEKKDDAILFRVKNEESSSDRR